MPKTVGQTALLVIATVIAYIPAMSAGFVWDDGQLLTQNALVRDPAGIWKVWVAPAAADSFPLTASALWIQCRLGNVFDMWNLGVLVRHADGGVVNGYHVVNIVLHGIAAVLVWRVLRVLCVPGAWLAAVLFALHPVCVESVAWISELKNTLSLLLFLLTLLVYFRSETAARSVAYMSAVGLFCLSLAAKPSVVPLPVVLWLAAWWRRGVVTRRDVLRSLPFVAAALIASVIALVTQTGGALGAEVIPIGGSASRLANAGMAVWFYLSKVFCPVHLVPIYPPWKVTPPAWYEFVPLIALIAIFVVCWGWRAQPWAHALFVALGYYTLMLLPALGLVKMSYMRVTLVADHFQYLAMISMIALAVAAGMRWLPRPLWLPAAGVVVLLFGGLSWAQATIYRNEETLWTETLKRNPDMWQAHNLLGVALFKKGDAAHKAEALTHFQRAVELKPDNPEAHNNLAIGYVTRGQLDLAIEEYRKAINLKDDASIRTNLGNALVAAGRYADAETQYRAALQMEPGNASRYANLGYVLMQEGRVDEARELYRQARQMDPSMMPLTSTSSATKTP